MTEKRRIHGEVKPGKGAFIAATLLVFIFALSTADSIGFVPYYIDGTPSAKEKSLAISQEGISLNDLPELGKEERSVLPPPTGTGGASQAPVALPESIVIPAIGLDLPIQNPSTRDINALDELLKKGPARYVDSVQLGQAGTMIVFAHSSHLPVVHNPMYKAFNRIPELEAGDTVTLRAGGMSYMYSITSVRTADANDTVISLSPDLGTRIVLVTCDTLTSKSSRYIAEATFIGVVPDN